MRENSSQAHRQAKKRGRAVTSVRQGAVNSQEMAVNRPAPLLKKPADRAATVAVHKQAAERGRDNARQNRSKPNSVEAIRARVRAEMAEESAQSRARTLERLAVEEEEERRSLEAQVRERQTMRREANAVYAREIAQEAALAAAANNDVHPSEPAAPSETGLSSRVETVQALLRDRAERRREDAESGQALRDRVASRRDTQRWGEAPTAGALNRPPHTSVGADASSASARDATLPSKQGASAVNHSLFKWTPPAPPLANGAPEAATLPRSKAAASAWQWAQRRDGTQFVVPTPSTTGTIDATSANGDCS